MGEPKDEMPPDYDLGAVIDEWSDPASSGGAAGAPAPSDPCRCGAFDCAQCGTHYEKAREIITYTVAKELTEDEQCALEDAIVAALRSAGLPADPMAWRADGYMRGSPVLSGCPWCAGCRHPWHAEHGRGSEPSAEAPTDPVRAAFVEGWDMGRVSGQASASSHPNDEWGQSATAEDAWSRSDSKSARLRGGATDGSLRHSLQQAERTLRDLAEHSGGRERQRITAAADDAAYALRVSGGSSSGGSPEP
jgi:hypothetical protein